MGGDYIVTKPVPIANYVFKAIENLDEKKGSSAIAIGRWLLARRKLSQTKVKRYLLRTLHRETEKGTLIRVKNSWKLSPELKKKMKMAKGPAFVKKKPKGPIHKSTMTLPPL